MSAIERRAAILLSVNRALLGMVKAHLRRVLVSWNDEAIVVRAVYDETMTEDDIEDVGVIETEIVSDFHDVCIVDCKAESIASGTRIEPRDNEVCIYARWENGALENKTPAGL